MLLLAALAAATPQFPARATVRIVRAQKVDSQEWQRPGRKREIVRSEYGRPVRIRVIEFE